MLYLLIVLLHLLMLGPMLCSFMGNVVSANALYTPLFNTNHTRYEVTGQGRFSIGIFNDYTDRFPLPIEKTVHGAVNYTNARTACTRARVRHSRAALRSSPR